MKKSGLLALALAMALSGSASAQILEFGLKATPEGISEIGFVYTEHYRVQPSVIVDLERRRLSEDDISVLLFLSGRARVAPEAVLRWRLAGDSWWVITERLRLDPAVVYYVPVPDHVRPGPPFGKAYGHFRKHPRGKTTLREALVKEQRIAFDDDDIRNLVQLRLVSEYYGHRPEDVMQRREQGEVFGRMIRAEYEKKHGKRQLKDALRQEKRERREEESEKKRKKYEDDHPGKGWKKYGED